MNTLIMHGPYTVDVNVYLTNGEQNAIAKCSLPPGKLPTAEAVSALVEQAVKETQKTVDPAYREMTRNLFENEIIAEHIGHHGQNFATADSWDPVEPIAPAELADAA